MSVKIEGKIDGNYTETFSWGIKNTSQNINQLVDIFYWSKNAFATEVSELLNI